MEKRIIFATGNENKMKEIRQILTFPGWEIVSMGEAGIDIDIVEDGATFEENALIKAKAAAECCETQGRAKSSSDRWIVLADDSGLEIDCLDGEPGIYSSRYAGEDTPYDVKNKMLLERLEGVPRERRTARFVCAVAAVLPGREPIAVRGTIEGYIGERPAGENGFGYDPIFYVEDPGCSTAQLSPQEKNARSHRGNALRLMRGRLQDILEE